jgi:polyisoprenoid-binding protein YceI
MKINFAFILASLFSSFCFSQSVDAERSVARFEIANFKFSTVEGTFKGFSGQVHFKPQKPEQSKIDVCLQVATVQSGIAKRDEHLQAPEWFHAAAHPQVCFQSTQIEKLAPNQFRAYGKLTIKGITRTVVVDLEQEPNHLTGSFKLNRLDYKVGEDTGTLTAGNTVTVFINCYFN